VSAKPIKIKCGDQRTILGTETWKRNPVEWCEKIDPPNDPASMQQLCSFLTRLLQRMNERTTLWSCGVQSRVCHNLVWIVMTMTMVCRQGRPMEAHGLPEGDYAAPRGTPVARIRGPYLKSLFSKLGHPHILYLHPCPATIITHFS
jgi:hypothetical protein